MWPTTPNTNIDLHFAPTGLCTNLSYIMRTLDGTLYLII